MDSKRTLFKMRCLHKRADIILKETARNRHVIIGMLPYVKNTNPNRDANSAKSVRHTEVDSQPSKKPKKSGGKGSVALLKNSKQLGCVFQDMGPKRSVQFSKNNSRPFFF